MANQIFPVRSPPSVVVTIIGVPFVVFIAVGTALSFRRERNLMSEEMRFTATLGARPRRGVSIDLPFDPDTTWGAKDRHYVTGSIEHYGLRGVLTPSRGEHVLQLGPAWCRDPRVGPGARVSVVLRPEGPQTGSMARDIAAALEAEPDARRFFESLATFYRKGFIRSIEEAKRPATRASRIAATVAALKAGRRVR